MSMMFNCVMMRCLAKQQENEQLLVQKAFFQGTHQESIIHAKRARRGFCSSVRGVRACVRAPWGANETGEGGGGDL